MHTCSRCCSSCRSHCSAIHASDGDVINNVASFAGNLRKEGIAQKNYVNLCKYFGLSANSVDLMM